MRVHSTNPSSSQSNQTKIPHISILLLRPLALPVSSAVLRHCGLRSKTCALARRGQGAWLVDDWYYSQLEEKPLCTSLGMTEVWVTIIAFPMSTVSYEVCPRIGRVCLLPSSLSPPEHPSNARALGSFLFDRYHGGAERHEALSCP